MAMVSDENGCRSPNGSGSAGQGSCEAGLRWKGWDGMEREREGKKNVGELKGVSSGSRCCCCMVHIYLMYKRLFPLFNYFFLFDFLFVLLIVQVQGDMEGSVEPFFKRIHFSDLQQQQQHCHFNQYCDDDDAAHVVFRMSPVASQSSTVGRSYTILRVQIFMSHQWSSG